MTVMGGCSRLSDPRATVRRMSFRDVSGGSAPNGPERQCQSCRKWRPEALFRSRSGRLTARCADCLEYARNQNRVLRARLGSAGVRADNLWQKYRITPEQYDALRSAQDHRCKICGIHEDDITGVSRGRPRLDGKPPAESFRLVVDHCHRGGQVRGLLCARCNAMIGQAADRPDVLRSAAAYLETQGDTPPEAQPCVLRIVDADPSGRPPRKVRFAGAVDVRIDGYVVRLAPGETRTVVSASGDYQLVVPSADPEVIPAD
jgi:hypothetical protein